MAPAEATLCFEMAQAQALQLNHWGGEPLPLNASYWVHDGGTATALLFVRLRGAVAAVEAACQKMLAQHPGQRLDNAQTVADWPLCRDLQLPFFPQPPSPQACLWRLSVPQTAPALDLPSPTLIEWHGASAGCGPPPMTARASARRRSRLDGNATLFIAAPCNKTVGYRPI